MRAVVALVVIGSWDVGCWTFCLVGVIGRKTTEYMQVETAILDVMTTICICCT